jgi:hypothetical protein
VENSLFPNDNLSWGYAKYKITILVAETNEKYQLYINSLDSKYGRVFTGGYGRDLYISYYPNNPINKKVVFSKKHATNNNLEVIDTIATWDTLANGKPSKEFKLWKVILGQDNPMEKNFYARTTPFPISPSVIYDNHIRELELGTKVIFDTVYNYTGLSDKYGYNTIVVPKDISRISQIRQSLQEIVKKIRLLHLHISILMITPKWL